METTVKTSAPLYQLDMRDLLRGLLMAAIGAAVTTAYELFLSEGPFDWSTVWKAAIGTALAYLVKNLFTPGEVIIDDVPKQTLKLVNKGELTATLVEQSPTVKKKRSGS